MTLESVLTSSEQMRCTEAEDVNANNNISEYTTTQASHKKVVETFDIPLRNILHLEVENFPTPNGDENVALLFENSLNKNISKSNVAGEKNKIKKKKVVPDKRPRKKPKSCDKVNIKREPDGTDKLSTDNILNSEINDTSNVKKENNNSYKSKIVVNNVDDVSTRLSRINTFIYKLKEDNAEYKKGYKYSCCVCQYKSKAKDSLNEHVQRVHIPAGNLSCQICGKKYNVMRDLKRHIRHHAMQFYCETCGKCYKEKRCFQQHKKKHDENYITKMWPCDECSSKFSTQYVLKSHILRVHRGIKEDHICTVCGKTFTQKTSLTQHMVQHSDNLRPFVCEFCNAAFTYQSSLRCHIKSQHTEKDIRSYICEICSKSYKTRGTLEKHKIKHERNKLIPCEKCGKKFSEASSVRRHMVVHTGELNHKCSLCGQSFNDASILRRHYQGVHKLILPKKKSGRPVPLKSNSNGLMENTDDSIIISDNSPPVVNATVPKLKDLNIGETSAENYELLEATLADQASAQSHNNYFCIQQHGLLLPQAEQTLLDINELATI